VTSFVYSMYFAGVIVGTASRFDLKTVPSYVSFSSFFFPPPSLLFNLRVIKPQVKFGCSLRFLQPLNSFTSLPPPPVLLVRSPSVRSSQPILSSGGAFLECFLASSYETPIGHPPGRVRCRAVYTDRFSPPLHLP